MKDKVSDIQKTKEDGYFKEVMDSLNTISNSNKYFHKLYYFINLAYSFFNEEQMAARNPKVILVGSSVPEEIVYAAGIKPMWILGGSLGVNNYSDMYVPRDTDAISRSILGFLKNEKFNLTKDATVIMPITCDSMRKMGYILSKDTNVITIDIPPNKYDSTSRDKWLTQMYDLSKKLQKISKTKITKESLRVAVTNVNNARKECRRFINNCKNHELLIPPIIRMFVLNTYYYADDIIIWTNSLKELNEEIECYLKNWKIPYKNSPKIMILGSPVFFPNYKIPFLLDSINLDIVSYVSCESQKIYVNSEPTSKNGSFKSYFEHVVLANYYCDCSSSYVNNETLYECVKNSTDSNNIQGVIYHVIKGQIEYDYELSKYEDYFTKKGIPVFRLETDYKYHDLEQIRIRVEAFAEMLTQNMIVASKIA